MNTYINGNYKVAIFHDGTKIRSTEENEFIPAFAENCDVKITDRCDGGCPYCYEGCSNLGKHGNILNRKFLETLHPYTELAINGNDLTHPDLVQFLTILKHKKVFANMTVNQIHFIKNLDFIHWLLDKKLICGLGVSLHEPTEEFINEFTKIPNAVLHVINGIVTPAQLETLANHNIKMLILGYKELKRGISYIESNRDEIETNQFYLYNHLMELRKQFSVISFDNLALRQLNVRSFLSDDEWEEFYMGEDAQFTFYIDLVEGKFAPNSLAPQEERYNLLDSIDEMFEKIRRR